MPEKTFPIKDQNRALDRIGQELKKQFDETEKQRQTYRETEWLESIRQVKGIYDPEVLAKIKEGKSKVYPRYTRSKVQPCVAKLNNMLFPDNDRNWEIQPTPEPKLTEEQINLIVQSLSVNEQGEPQEVTTDDVEHEILELSNAAVGKMQTAMDDQLTEDDYRIKAKGVIKSSVLLGTGILKGPLSKGKIKRKLEKIEDKYIQKESTVFVPWSENVSLWKWFPDMSSTELAHCNFVYELNAMTRHELRKLAKKKNFKSDVILEYLKNHKEGDYKLRDWEIDLATIKDEENVKRDSKKYQVLEYNGYLDGHDLFMTGIIKEEEEANKDWFVNVWILGDRVIKAILHPIESLEELYHVFYFEKDDSSIFGEGLPRIIRDTQISICSAIRAMLDNAAWVSGPIFELNGDLMPDEELDDVYPGRAFEREGRGADAQYPAIRVYNVDSRINDYLAIVDKFEQIGDMESTLPAFLFGGAAKTTNETAKGISIRDSNTNLTINDIVKNFDEANESFLRALHKWNMAYNPDPSIKGDMEVKAIGSSSLVSKEVRTQSLDYFAQTLRPEDEPYIKRRVFLEERIKLHDLDHLKLLNTEKEAEKIIEGQRDTEAIQLEKLRLESEIRYENAKAMNMESKAEATFKGISNDEINTMISALEKIKGARNEPTETSPGV